MAPVCHILKHPVRGIPRPLQYAGYLIDSPGSIDINTPLGRIAALSWGQAGAPPVLALHGWLDNAASFSGLGPLLDNFHFIALDLPGHGLSAHKRDRQVYHLVDAIAVVIAVADRLAWPQFHLLGHSLGANIACLLAAAFPSRIDKLVLIEGIGPTSGPDHEAPQRLANAVQRLLRLDGQEAPVYSDIEQVIRARRRAGRLNAAAASTLVQRNLRKLPGGGYRWRSDPRLALPSPLYLSETQVMAFLREIQAPTLLIRAWSGYLHERPQTVPRLQVIPDLTLVDLPGGHHLHLDDPEPVAGKIEKFLN